MRRRLGLGAAVLVASLAVAPVATAAAPGPAGYAGVWETIECPTWEDGGHGFRCDLWGDGSTLRLVVAPGDAPRLLHTDSYSSYCADDLDSPVVHWVSRGIGSYDETGMLWADFTTGGCGSVDIGPHTMGALYLDPGSDTLWLDPDGDGWGLTWWRVGG